MKEILLHRDRFGPIDIVIFKNEIINPTNIITPTLTVVQLISAEYPRITSRHLWLILRI